VFVLVDYLRAADMSAKSGRSEVFFIVIAGAAAQSQVRGSHFELGTNVGITRNDRIPETQDILETRHVKLYLCGVHPVALLTYTI
jgi:hypothetical protein